MRHIHRGDTYTTLRHASLTCKWWYPAAMQALSTHVLLVDGRQTRLFAKLVKRNPRLTSSVRSLSYVDTLDNKIFYSSGLSEDRLPDRIESNIAFILQICDNIDTISFSLRASLTSLTHMRWRREPPIIMHIRSLTLHGHALDTRTGDLVFPVLEYLSLRSIDSWDNINITRSIFPKLREIALVHPYNLEDMHNAAVKVASLQTLRSLAFIHAPSFSHGFSFPHIPQLSRLYIMGRSPSIDFGWLPSASSPLSCNRLQHLTFGIVDPISSNALKGWVLPPMLESLTVYIGDIEARRFDCLLRNIEPTAFLYNFLEANTLEIRSRVFRTLVVHILDPGGDSIVERSQFVASAIERVEKMCNWLGVTFVLQQSGELFPTFICGYR